MQVQVRNSFFFLPPQRAFTLVEVLVAALLLGVALLGIGAFQNWSLQVLGDIRFQHQARNHAIEIIERMRADSGAAASYVTGPDSGAAPCAPYTVGAAAGLACWHDALRRTLPEAEGRIALSGGAVPLVTVTISWARRGGGADDDKPRTTLRWSARL